MVQVLPYVQTPLEQLTPFINQAAGSVGQGIGQFVRNKKDQTLLNAFQNPETSDIDKTTIWSKLSPEARKIYEPEYSSHLRKQEASHKENIKRETADIEKAEKAESVIGTVKKMRDRLKYTGSVMIPFTPSFNAIPEGLNREGLQKRNEFDVLAASAASFFRDLETKGQLPQGLYEEVIKPRLPNSKLSERENEGRLVGLEELAEEYGGKAFKKAKETKTSKEPSKSSEKGKKLTDEIVDKFLAEANNDPVEAKRLAKEQGYDV